VEWNCRRLNANNPNYALFITTVTAGTPNTWALTLPVNMPLNNGATYKFVSRAADNAGNTEFAASTAPFGVGIQVLYDTAPPVFNIVSPVDTKSYQA